MEYEHLTPEEQREMLKGRLKQLEQEHLGHSLNVEEWNATLLGLDAPNRKAVKEQIDQSDLAIKTLDRKHNRAKARLAQVEEKIAQTAGETETPE